MQISVLVEPIANNGYRATGGQPLPVVVEAATREEALAKVKEQLEARLRNGTEIVQMEIGSQPHPWMEFAGMFKDDPYFEDVLKIMAENRRKMDRPRKAAKPRKARRT